GAADADRVLPALPAGAAEFAGEIKALDMAGGCRIAAAVMIGDERRQRDRSALAGRGAVGDGGETPDGSGSIEAGRTGILPEPDPVEGGDRPAGERRRVRRIIFGDDPAMRQRRRRQL